MNEQPLMGVHEVAEALGIRKQSLATRRSHAYFPQPVANLRCGPIWERAAIEEYVRTRDPAEERRWHAWTGEYRRHEAA